MKNIAAATSIPNIVECKKGFQQYVEKVDKINSMLDRIDDDLKALENNVEKAEDELGYNNTGIKGFFKPFLEKVVKGEHSNHAGGENSVEIPVYQPINVFKSSDYFDSNCDQSNEFNEKD